MVDTLKWKSQIPQRVGQEACLTMTKTELGGVGLFGWGPTPQHYFMAHGPNAWHSGKGIYIKTDGRIGVGTTNPDIDAKLHVNGNLYSGNQNITGNVTINGGHIKLNKPNTAGGWARGFLNYDDNGDEIGGVGLLGWGNSIKHYFMAHGPNAWHSGKGIYVKASGDVGIGTTSPSHRLDVCGTARAREVLVEEGWCDYVFEEDYNLPSIEEQMKHIETYGYMPNFESAETMDGEINLGDITKRQQQTIEEQMLYIGQLNEDNKILKTQNAALSQKYDALLKIVTELQAQIQK